jgi:hypothetical protein
MRSIFTTKSYLKISSKKDIADGDNDDDDDFEQ